MSIFDGIPDPESDSEQSDWRGLMEAVRSIDMRNLATYLGCTWDKYQKYIRCPRHAGGGIDENPSGFVYPDHVYCFSCGAHYSPIDLIAATNNLDFKETMHWLEENITSIANLPAPVLRSSAAEYNGEAPQEIVWYWHTKLTEERRAYLHNRMILDRTIDELWIGWRPDFECYTIPFWRGVPGHSAIDIVQYRHTRGEKRYTGMRGHNRSSIINAHLIGTSCVALLFGTFDAILAAQDGIAAISTNGASAFTKDADNLSRLKTMLGGCHVYLVPDKSDTEAKPAHVLAHALRADVRHFPADLKGKDYTDFRMEGRTPSQFFQEVLMIADGFIAPEHDEYFTNILYNISVGGFEGAETLLLVLEHYYPKAAVVNQHLQARLMFDPFPGLRHEQWATLRESITRCLEYPQIQEWAKVGCQMGADNRGAF